MVKAEGRGYDLIAISRGTHNNASQNGLWGWHSKERPREELLYEYYNVLWIEKDVKTGISERIGLGHVMKTAWEKLELTPIDVTLE